MSATPRKAAPTKTNGTPAKATPTKTTPTKSTPSKVATPSKKPASTVSTSASPAGTPRRKTRSQTGGQPSPPQPLPSRSTPKKAAATASKAASSSSSPSKKASPAKARAPTSGLATATSITAEYSDEDEDEDGDEELELVTAEDEGDEEEEDEEEEEVSDSETEDGQDVSEKGLQRLMEALGDDGLTEDDFLQLQAARGELDEEDEDEEDAEDDEDDEELLEDEEADEEDAEEEEEELLSVKPNANGDTLAASIARSGLVPEVESEDEEDDEDLEGEDEIAYEDLPDNIELSEEAKASRVQRIKVNNKEALLSLYQDIRLDVPGSSKLPWIETMRVTYDRVVADDVPDADNDLERELAFYKQALHTAIEGRKLVEASGTPFSRPNDYFAEMVKTDEHMERIRQKLLDESASIKASEAAKKQRELKKFGKKVQVEKLEERLRKKKEMNEKVKSLKRKHSNLDDGGEDDFDVRLDDAFEDKPSRAKKGKAGPGPGGAKGGAKGGEKARMPRHARDAKYGNGGMKKRSKSNTAESTNDFGNYSGGSFGGTSKVAGKAFAKGGKGRPVGGPGAKGKPKTGAAKRPGKSRRHGGGKR